MKLFLFDIDGTLLSTLGEGSLAFQEAYKELYGTELDWSSRDFAGRTDEYISRASLELINSNTKENRANLLDAYIKKLKKRLLGKPPRILPGVLEIIQKLKNQDGSTLGLLTGNIIAGAKVKLGHLFGDFELGAFGDKNVDRNLLPKIAISLFHEKYGSRPTQTLVIGDTPRDIECAKKSESVSIAVATGPYSEEELNEADFVLGDLKLMKNLPIF